MSRSPRRLRRLLSLVLCAALSLTAGCSASGTRSPTTSAAGSTATSTGSGTASPYRWRHVVVLIMGSRSYDEVLGSNDAPFLSLLARSGVSFIDAHAVSRAAQPNYLALFSASTQSVTTDRCPLKLRAANLADQLEVAGLSFRSYSQSLPHAGYRGCRTDPYVTAHDPVASFVDVPDSANLPFKDFPSNFGRLPTVSFLIPDTAHSMADSLVGVGDAWVRSELTRYATWVTSHQSLLVITWDRASESSTSNRIPMLAIGAGVTDGVSDQPVGPYELLATLQQAYGLPRFDESAKADPIAALGG